VKCRGNGFRQLYDWLNSADFLIRQIRSARATRCLTPETRR
jgi:hypothetical protein